MSDWVKQSFDEWMETPHPDGWHDWEPEQQLYEAYLMGAKVAALRAIKLTPPQPPAEAGE